MKIAVDRWRLDLHAGARLRASRASGPASTSATSSSTTSTPSGVEVVGGLARRMLDRGRATAARSTITGRPRRCGRRRRLRPDPDPGRRAGGPALGRDGAARLRLHRPGDDRRGRASRRRCALCRSCSRSPSASGERARAGRMDRRLHEPGRDRHPGAARRGPSRDRPLQRRDRLPARVREAARRRAGAGAARPRRPQPPDLGPRVSASTASDVLPELLDDARRRARASRSGLPAASARRARRDPVVLPALLLRTRPACSPSSSAASRGRTTSRRSSAQLLEHLPRPEPRTRSRRCSSSAAARSTARRRRRSSPRSRPTAATSTSSTCETTARSRASPTTTSSRSRRGSTRGGAEPLPQAPLAPELLGLVQHVAAYERLAAEAAVTRRSGDRAEGAARASADRPGRAQPRTLARARSRLDELRDGGSCDERSCRPRRRRRQLEDRPRARARGRRAARARARAAESSPHHLGSTVASRVLEELLDEAARQRRSRPARRPSPRSAQLFLAGVDFPAEEDAVHAAVAARGWASGVTSATTRSPSCARHRARLGRRGRLRRRDQLRRRRARRTARRASPRSA